MTPEGEHTSLWPREAQRAPRQPPWQQGGCGWCSRPFAVFHAHTRHSALEGPEERLDSIEHLCDVRPVVPDACLRKQQRGERTDQV